MPDFDKKFVASLLSGALIVAAAFFILVRQPAKIDPQAAVLEETKLDLQKMIEEDRAAAKAQAEFNAMMREAEMNAADDILNSMTAETNLTQPLLTDEAPIVENSAQPDEPAAQSNVLSRDIYLRGAKEKSPQ